MNEDKVKLMALFMITGLAFIAITVYFARQPAFVLMASIGVLIWSYVFYYILKMRNEENPKRMSEEDQNKANQENPSPAYRGFREYSSLDSMSRYVNELRLQHAQMANPPTIVMATQMSRPNASRNIYPGFGAIDTINYVPIDYTNIVSTNRPNVIMGRVGRNPETPPLPPPRPPSNPAKEPEKEPVAAKVNSAIEQLEVEE